jgi:hypothetical protein
VTDDDWSHRAAEFARQYAVTSGLSISEIQQASRTVVPCNCGQPGCPGWESTARKLWRDAEFRKRSGGDFVWLSDGQAGQDVER